jgi:hypothetical protein
MILCASRRSKAKVRRSGRDSSLRRDRIPAAVSFGLSVLLMNARVIIREQFERTVALLLSGRGAGAVSSARRR